MKIKFTSLLTIALIMVLLSLDKTKATAQQDNRKVRIANIQIDSAYIDEYKAALAEHAKTAVRVEPGVLALQAVYDKRIPLRLQFLKYTPVKKLTRCI
jgi:hypothetical protein